MDIVGAINRFRDRGYKLKVKEDEIILYLVETGSHSDIFNM